MRVNVRSERSEDEDNGNTPDAHMSLLLQPKPLGTPSEGAVPHVWVAASHVWLTHCCSGLGIGALGSPLAHAALAPPQVPSVPQKKNAWQSLSDEQASPR